MIIIDMPMPKGCMNCPIRDEEDAAWVACPLAEIAYRKCNVTYERMDECPIKGEISDGHGRLIDADVFAFYLRVRAAGGFVEDKGVSKDFLDGVRTAYEMLKTYPTVVPADKEDA